MDRVRAEAREERREVKRGKEGEHRRGLVFSRNFCGGIQNSITCWERS